MNGNSMDSIAHYKVLADKMIKLLPMKAYPVRELVRIFRDKGNPITLKTELIITDVHNSGDVSGIMCVVKNDKEDVMACALTHLIFSRQNPLFKEIAVYQKKREKRIRKLNNLGLN